MLLPDEVVVNNQVLMFSNNLIFTANWQLCCHLAVKLLAPLATPTADVFRKIAWVLRSFLEKQASAVDS